MKNLSAERAKRLKREYSLEKHSEGGWFSEVYTAPFEKDERSLAGSIYFLLDGEEISHFHQIDCDEIWYYHEGCGMKITLLKDNSKQELFLGSNIFSGEKFMAVIPKGAIFAAENLEKDKFTFVSCATAPKFKYEGFRLVSKTEIREKYPLIYDEIEYLSF